MEAGDRIRVEAVLAVVHRHYEDLASTFDLDHRAPIVCVPNAA
jgi:hypothetical protein